MRKKPDFIQKTLQEHHFRLTTVRVVLLSILTSCKIPLSAGSILQRLLDQKQSVNKTTVYRALEQFRKKGIVREVYLKDRKQYYELAFREHHHHFVCVECECVEDVAIDEEIFLQQEKQISGKNGFIVLKHSVEFFGLCSRCQTHIA